MKINFKKTLVLFVFTLTVLSVKSQEHKDHQIESGIVYTNFRGGGSTSAIKYNSIAIDSMKSVGKIKLKQEDIDTLQMILSNVKARKHSQQKVGPCYYIKIIINQVSHRIALIPGIVMIDLTDNKQFLLKSQDYIDFTKRFIQRNKL
nr:hypothetical protein [Pedobacter sp. ASV2]